MITKLIDESEAQKINYSRKIILIERQLRKGVRGSGTTYI